MGSLCEEGVLCFNAAPRLANLLCAGQGGGMVPTSCGLGVHCRREMAAGERHRVCVCAGRELQGVKSGGQPVRGAF